MYNGKYRQMWTETHRYIQRQHTEAEYIHKSNMWRDMRRHQHLHKHQPVYTDIFMQRGICQDMIRQTQHTQTQRYMTTYTETNSKTLNHIHRHTYRTTYIHRIYTEKCIWKSQIKIHKARYISYKNISTDILKYAWILTNRQHRRDKRREDIHSHTDLLSRPYKETHISK